MSQFSNYRRCVNTIEKEDFIKLFPSLDLVKCFSERELKEFPLKNNSGSLAGRYLIKRAICDQLKEIDYMSEIEILNDKLGKPEINLGTNISRSADLAGIKKIICSISHSRNLIATMTIFCY